MKAEPTLRAVLDTNVWLSAALSPAGAPAQVVRTVLLQGVPAFSEATFAELQTRLWKPKFDRYLSLETRRALLRDARAAAQWVAIPSELSAQHWSSDRDDDDFIRTALAAKAPWLVTGDDDLLCLAPLAGLAILRPAQALVAWSAFPPR
ncbi:MAG: hypothetical protein Fur007_20610 [Rhodoferax sp.]